MCEICQGSGLGLGTSFLHDQMLAFFDVCNTSLGILWDVVVKIIPTKQCHFYVQSPNDPNVSG